MDILAALSDIPEGIVGVIIGSVLAFGGTYVATRQQLRHDAEQRERDRKMQLRRDVFIEAAAGVPTPEYFVRIANAETPLTELGVATPNPTWMNKLYAAASPESLEAFADAGAGFAASSLELFARRIAIEDVKANIDNVNQQVAALNELQQNIRAVAAQIQAQEPTDESARQLEKIQADWDQVVSASRSLGEQLSQLLDEKLRLQRELLHLAVTHTLAYQKRLRKALVTLRLELDFPLDPDKLEAAMERIDKEMVPRFQKMMDAIESSGSTPAA